MASERGGKTSSLESLMGLERSRLLEGMSGERREQMRAAERQREVYAAWNTVCGATREGSHVTGLHYLPNSNELVVYMDGASWTQEMAMMREIIRARMSIAGVDVANLIFKTSREGYRARGSAYGGAARKKSASSAAPRRELTEGERAEVERAAAGICDEDLRGAFTRAMIASLELSEPQETDKSPYN